jgi:hypothetical protein
MVRRSAYEAVGEFDNRFGFCSDVDMWMRLAHRFPVAYVDEPLIALPSRDALPRLNDETRAKQQRLLETMFWEARVRQFAGRPLRLAVEVVRHFGFVLAVRGWDRALRLRRALLRAPRVW